MATTKSVPCKFIVKETENGSPYLAIEFLGEPPEELNGKHLALHFWNSSVAGKEAQAAADDLNDRFERMSVLSFSPLDGFVPEGPRH